MLFQVLSLVNDSSQRCRTRIAAVISTLLAVLSKGGGSVEADVIMTSILRWIRAPQADASKPHADESQGELLRRAALQLAGVAVKGMADGYQKHAGQVLKAVRTLVHTEANRLRRQQADGETIPDTHDEKDGAWRLPYAALICLEKLMEGLCSATVKFMWEDKRQVGSSPQAPSSLLICG